MKEASARIKINKLLEAAGWRFFADEKGLTPTTVSIPKTSTKFEKSLFTPTTFRRKTSKSASRLTGWLTSS